MRRVAILLAVLAAGCTVRFSDLAECKADSDCASMGAGLVCDVAASVCVSKSCTDSTQCGSLGADFVCDSGTKVCAKFACARHEECATFGDNYACRAGTCTNACFPAAFSAGPGEKAVKMGAIFPISADAKGSENVAVRVRRWSVELALQQINKDRGGIQVGSLEARKIDFAFCDTAGDAQLAGRLAKYLTDQNRVALLTGGTAETQAVLPVAKPKGTMVVSVSATADALTVLNGNPVDNSKLFVRLAPRDSFQGAAIAEELARRVEGTSGSIGVVYENKDYGKGLREAIRNGWDPTRIVDVAFDPANPASVLLTEVAERQPSFTVVATNAANAAEILRQFQKYDFLAAGATVPLLTDSATNPTVLDQLGDKSALLKGGLGIVIWLDQNSKAFQDYKRDYQVLRSGPSGGGGFTSFEKDGTFGPQAYDATYVLALATAAALQRAGSGGADGLTGRQLSAVLPLLNDPGAAERFLVGSTDFTAAAGAVAASRGINLTGTSGSLDFDDNGDVPGSYGLCRFDGNPVAFDLRNCTEISRF